MTAPDPDEQRAATRESWENAAAGWGRHAERIRDWSMPVSVAMIEALALQPGLKVLELAAGPGDTGFLAAELIQPGGTLICTDGASAMLEVARGRAAQLGISNVEFHELELEWIDLPTADVDALLCRWGIMFAVDPAAAAREMRRVLRPGGRAAVAVWDVSERNPWATLPNATLIALGHAEPPDPNAPGMFVMGAEGVLGALLEEAGFAEVTVTAVPLVRRHPSVEDYVRETTEMSPMFSSVFAELDAGQQSEVAERVAAAAVPFTADDGSVALPGSALVGAAAA
ncbi:MAG: methyltransferase domain-containing protein [Solirubrobacteraceae bacterium]